MSDHEVSRNALSSSVGHRVLVRRLLITVVSFAEKERFCLRLSPRDASKYLNFASSASEDEHRRNSKIVQLRRRVWTRVLSFALGVHRH